MSDQEMPAWAYAMESRLSTLVAASVEGLAATVESRVDVREHHLAAEISQAINQSSAGLERRIADLRVEMTRRFDQIHDDLTVNLARADVAIERVQRLEGDVRKELSQLQRRLRELEHWRDHRPGERPAP